MSATHRQPATGHLAAICVSAERGTVKTQVPDAELRADFGLVGDAHAGPGPRQVSLLGTGSIAKVRAQLPDLQAGAFAENLVVAGLDLTGLRIGDRLTVGQGRLEVTQIGKECHNACAIRQQTGDCVMPREGVFCRILVGASLRVGDPVRILARQEATS